MSNNNNNSNKVIIIMCAIPSVFLIPFSNVRVPEGSCLSPGLKNNSKINKITIMVIILENQASNSEGSYAPHLKIYLSQGIK